MWNIDSSNYRLGYYISIKVGHVDRFLILKVKMVRMDMHESIFLTRVFWKIICKLYDTIDP